MLKHQAVIFDLDGTLTDSAPGILDCVSYALGQLGYPLPEEKQLRRFLGPPLMESFTKICGLSKEQAIEAQGVYRKRYHHEGYLNNSVYPGIRQLLQTLKNAGVYLAVATHKPLKPSLKILEAFHLLHYFDTIAGPDEDESPTKGELILRANPKGLSAIMIGDRYLDAEGASQAGIQSVAVLYGYGKREEFIQADYFAETVEDLYDIIEIEQPAPQGYFISLEGNDGSGKSTQAHMLAEKLRQCGYDVLLTREPGGTKIGEKIRDLLLDTANRDMHPITEALLYAAARAQHVQQIIIPALCAGKLVISDRFVDSSIAYQGAGRQLGLQEVAAINAPAIDGILPETTVFLSVDPAEGMRRRTRSSIKDRLEEEADAFHQRVGKAFQEMTTQDSRFVTVSSQSNKHDTAQIVFQVVMKRLQAHGMP